MSNENVALDFTEQLREYMENDSKITFYDRVKGVMEMFYANPSENRDIAFNIIKGMFEETQKHIENIRENDVD